VVLRLMLGDRLVAGVRYFRFQDSLSVSAVTPDGIVAGGADAYFNDTVTQPWSAANWFRPRLQPGLQRTAVHQSKFGIYGNWVDSNFRRAAAKGR